MLTVLDLFSGIGGFSLGLERTGGFKTIAFCEIDPFCRRVLAKHWPGVPIYEDVRQASFVEGFCDIICGGFPCQDVSRAGHREGLAGERSGLWSEYLRLIRDIRPRYVIVENVSDLLSLGMGTVLGDLAESGYDAEWDCLPAASVGAPHIRDRVWILAYPRQEHGGFAGRDAPPSRRNDVFPQRNNGPPPEWREDRELVALVPGVHPGMAEDWWRSQSRMDRSANGLPNQVERNCSLGNAVVPQIPELIGRAILKAESEAGRHSRFGPVTIG